MEWCGRGNRTARPFVTDAEYKHALGIVRSLGSKGLAVYCGSTSSSPSNSSYSRYVCKSLVYPDPKLFPELFKSFIEKLAKFDCEIVIPVGYDAVFTSAP
jgi:hypothetical protein